MRKPAAILLVLSLAVLALALIPAAGLAAKGGNSGGNSASGGGGGQPGGGSNGGSLTLQMVSDQNGDNAPNWSDQVTFDVSTSAEQPEVNVRCYQGSTFVYDAWGGFFAGAWFSGTFTLSSTYWPGGAADCSARLVSWSKNGREQTLATLDFTVAA